MKFTTEENGEISNIDEQTLFQILTSDTFGAFAILSISKKKFIQAGNAWSPSVECEAFMDATGSDPWVLEYREGGPILRASGFVTLDQVCEAFQAYLQGNQEWRSRFVWSEWDG